MLENPNFDVLKSDPEIEKNNENQLLERRGAFIDLYVNDTKRRLGPVNSIDQALEKSDDPLSPLIVVIDYGGKKIKLTLHINGDVFETNKNGKKVSLENAGTISPGLLIDFRNELNLKFPLIEKEYDSAIMQSFEERGNKAAKAVKYLVKNVVHSPLIVWGQRFEDPTDAKSPLILSLNFSNGDVITLKAPLNSDLFFVKNERTNEVREYHTVEFK
jgi:hypothetical protein